MKKKVIIISCLTLILLLSAIFVINNKNEIHKNEEVPKLIKNNSNISLMIEQTANQGDYEMAISSDWPTEDYVFNKELSKCENGGELSWDEENKIVLMSGVSSDKCYVYFDKLPPKLYEYILENVWTGTQGDNSLYYHNGTITSDDGSILDAEDNSYRYAGANPDNYVCFGTDALLCPTDNLYRIIGIFDNKIKLIKYDFATSSLLGRNGDYHSTTNTNMDYYKGNLTSIASYNWNYKSDTSANSGMGSTNWATSLLNKTNLNTNFLSNIGNDWASKIEVFDWKIMNPNQIFQNPVKKVYYYEKLYSSNIYSAKIGLMYPSDYGFAASPSAWTTKLQYPSGYDYSQSSVTSVNWMYMGMNEWTISPKASSFPSIYITYVEQIGSLGGMSPNPKYYNRYVGVRPTFYLKSDVRYAGGVGSSTDPYRISMN